MPPFLLLPLPFFLLLSYSILISFLPLSSASPFSNEKPEFYSYRFPLVRSFILILPSLYLNIIAPSHFVHLPCRWRQQVTPKNFVPIYQTTLYFHTHHCGNVQSGPHAKIKNHTSINSSKCWLLCSSNKAFIMW